jgi:hypothetical protein
MSRVRSGNVFAVAAERPRVFTIDRPPVARRLRQVLRVAFVGLLGTGAFIGVERVDEHAGWTLGRAALAQLSKCPASIAPARNFACFVEVTANPVGTQCGDAQITLDPPEIEFKKTGAVRNPVRIVFRINQDNGQYGYCRTLGDGIFLKDKEHAKHGQFVRMYSTDDDGVDDAAPEDETCGKRFRVKFKNRANNVAKEDTKYEYVLVFRDLKSNLSCRKDPWIKNGK